MHKVNARPRNLSGSEVRHDEVLDNPSNKSLPKKCGSKTPPFTQAADFRANLVHIYCGQHAVGEVAEGYFYCIPAAPTAAFALPWGHSPYEFTWPVSGRRCVIHNDGLIDDVIYQTAHALTLCGAREVFHIYRGELVVWRESVEEREAA